MLLPYLWLALQNVIVNDAGVGLSEDMFFRTLSLLTMAILQDAVSIQSDHPA